MSKDTRITSRYAKAIVSLAQEKGELERVKEDASLIKETCEHSRELALLLASPIVQHTQKINSLEAIFKSKVSEIMIQFIRIVCNKGRANILYDISVAIIQAFNDLKGIQGATVITAVEISDSELANFEKLVKQNTTKQSVTLETKVDKDLIGGFVLNIGDRQIDESVHSKLNDLSVQFSK